MEIDYLLLVNDEARQGALRFAEKEGGPFLAHSSAKPIPPLVSLPRLLSAAERVAAEDSIACVAAIGEDLCDEGKCTSGRT
jgi:serine/threonine-protein kinase HipA